MLRIVMGFLAQAEAGGEAWQRGSCWVRVRVRLRVAVKPGGEGRVGGTVHHGHFLHFAGDV